jgi:hypothetical protein
MALELVNQLSTQYSVDKNRLYITGLSLGGFGTWDAIMRYPDLFAAAVPICGAGDPSKASLIKNVPVFAFHSADDPIVPVAGSRDMVAALKAVNGNVNYMEYTDQGHGSWYRAYSDGLLYSWMFRQDKTGEHPEPVSSQAASSLAPASSVSGGSSKAASKASVSSSVTGGEISTAQTSSSADNLSSSHSSSSSSRKASSAPVKSSGDANSPGIAVWLIIAFASLLFIALNGAVLYFLFIKKK